ncbi:MFS transporter [Burkholderia pseudomallei]|uniref:MFS transporter n=1 Tax=Burkholderia pseudomallei TaxID=28450 RepID=UPI00016AF814|nr:MFS transporter [Burkholderia pseudomallei]AFR14771.1 major facilitator family transporter [Burkholderia pseudomallei BPC006]MBF3682374.1 MFS transporter [Burkholderia pseudomallei]MBF3823406.1 MFS transporter [Burkholderia pseudomallei]MBF3941633.1 MFS transporter [Burkholderia pseudomallei]MBF4031849.1 MFS transporter [Burkholderia pseudomallei]
MFRRGAPPHRRIERRAPEARMSARHGGAPLALDIGATLDHGPFTAMQRVAVLLAAFAIVLDGFDSQLIGFAIPVLIKEWGITRDAFAPAVAAGLFGMGVGSACAGLFADRFGRRWAIIGSVFVFGAATCAIGFAPNVATIAALRFVAGLGIGGALPTATTMTAEYTPARRRTMMVTATIVCVPAGGMLAGLFAHEVLPAYGWRGLFWLGGALPLALGLLLVRALPESPRYLARNPARWRELGALLARMGRPVADGTAFTDLAEARAHEGQRRGVRALFSAAYARDTIALWCAFCMCLLAVYSAFSWLPTMLTSQGLSVSVAGSGLTAYNLGGVLGALGCALAIGRFGSRWPLAFCCAGGAASAAWLLGVDAGSHAGWLIVGLAAHGFFVNAVQSTMYALCTFIYPTPVRATGTAGAVAFGRVGAILSAFAGAYVISAGGANAYLAMLAAAMAVVLAALLALRRHIPRLRRGGLPAADELARTAP